MKFTNEDSTTVTEQNSDMPIFNPTVIDTDTTPQNSIVKGKRSYNTNDLVKHNDTSKLYAPKIKSNSSPGIGLAIASLLCGIIGFLTGMLPFLSLPLGVIGIACSLISRKQAVLAGNPMPGVAIGGLITSVLALLGGGFWGLLWIIAAMSI